MKTESKIEAGGMNTRQNQRVTDSLKVKSGVKAGTIRFQDLLVSSY
jgi:hypothetical protein